MTATSSWYAANLSLLLCRLTFDVADGIEVPLMMHAQIDDLYMGFWNPNAN